MDLRHLRHLCAVVEHGSLGRASVVLGISEPALSKSVRALEDRLGVRLLDRGPKGMVPTASGHALYARARAILAEVEHATTEIAELRGLSKGVVRVGAQPSLASVLPRAIAALQASRAAVRVIAQIGTTDLLEQLRNGGLDFIVVTLAPELHDRDFVEDVLFEDEAILVAGATSPFAQAVRLDALLAAPFVLPRRPDPLRVRFDEAFRLAALDPPEASVETSSDTLIRACIERHGFLGLMPRLLIDDALAAGTVVPVGPPDLRFARRVGAIRRRRASLSPPAQALLTELRNLARVLGRGR